MRPIKPTYTEDLSNDISDWDINMSDKDQIKVKDPTWSNPDRTYIAVICKRREDFVSFVKKNSIKANDLAQYYVVTQSNDIRGRKFREIHVEFHGFNGDSSWLDLYNEIAVNNGLNPLGLKEPLGPSEDEISKWNDSQSKFPTGLSAGWHTKDSLAKTMLSKKKDNYFKKKVEENNMKWYECLAPYQIAEAFMRIGKALTKSVNKVSPDITKVKASKVEAKQNGIKFINWLTAEL